VSWVLLVVAGLLEVAWASALPATAGLTRVVPTSAFVVALAGSMLLLARATESIPLGTAYTVWVGIGAVGTSLVTLVAHRQPATAAHVGFLALLVVAILGVKFTGH
jgi:quaternary ammonium compound-resistance protein SugE